ncbi:FtsP/CotA-like multicopper oxidase with cupredoxin domain [Pseudomonas sp. TE3786]
MTTRRTFVKTLAAGTVLGGLGLWRTPTWAVSSPGQQQVLSGTNFDLVIGEAPVNFTGAPRTAITVNGSLPGPLLRWREGDTVTLRVKNRLREDTSIHWHGILLPANMDGVPGLSFNGIAPDGLYTYQFTVKQHGTYWYHSHSGMQEQAGVYGPLVIDPREPEAVAYERDYVVMLSDWTDENPNQLLRTLKKQADYYNSHKRTLGDFIDDVGQHGWRATFSERLAWAQMRMTPTDIADVSGQTYTYLINGHTPDANWTGLFQPGERLRLRLINAGSMSYFDLRIPGLKMTVIAADGQAVNPVSVDELRLAPAETYDVIVQPAGAEAYTLFAQAMDRSGYACATLAVRQGLRAAVPVLDPRPQLSMADMGMNHGDMKGMDHSQMAGMQQHPASETDNPLVDMQTMAPTAKLDDPGLGLRANSRRVLTYSDLHSSFADPDGRAPSRTLELHLTGHMEKFAWSFDGVPFSAADPIRLSYGERVRIVLVNDTMMSHPIHLHGLWSDLEDEHGNFQVRKHTIDMPPGSKRSYRVSADALGRWAYHCHLLLHMDAGMMREVRVEEGQPT